MNISEETLESELNDLVDKIEEEKNTEKLKLMNDNLFDVDVDSDYDTNFNIGEPKKKVEPKIEYF